MISAKNSTTRSSSIEGLLDRLNDQLTIERINKLIASMEAQKAALHSEQHE